MEIYVRNIVNKSVIIEKLSKFNQLNISHSEHQHDYILIEGNEGLFHKIYNCKYKYLIENISNNFEIVNEYKSLNIKDFNINDVFIVYESIGSKLIGVVTILEISNFLKKELIEVKCELENAKTDLEAIMKCSEDLTCISDGNGSKLRISASAEKYYGLRPEELIGKNVEEVEKMGIYFPSATKLAIKERKQVIIVQKTKTSRKLLVTATPVLDENGKIKRIVSISKDITDEEKLKNELKLLRNMIERYEYELASLREKNIETPNILNRSKTMKELLEILDKVALVDSTVLITGETGVGKELIAKYIHSMSKRNIGPFIKINCAAIPENLLEAELFGYEKGAFTGAKNEGKPGLIEIADKGTLFLDEIGEMPLSLQAKLLRVLQEKEFIKIGGIKSISVDVRIITATNKNLKDMVMKGLFREDLYYRLNVVPITVPPLRNRTEDIPILAYHFLNWFNEKYNKSKQFDKEVIDNFMKYSWPGNVRELENIVERLVVLSKDDIITANDLPAELSEKQENIDSKIAQLMKIDADKDIGQISLKEIINNVEFEVIRKAVETYGSTYKAAEILGIDQSTVVRKMNKYKYKYSKEV